MIRTSTNSEKTSIEIENLTWNEYNRIMIALDLLVNQLEKPLNDVYLNNHRLEMISKYGDLFESLRVGSLPWRGDAVSLDDKVIGAVFRSSNGS
jgi:hypothetical protein